MLNFCVLLLLTPDKLQIHQWVLKIQCHPSAYNSDMILDTTIEKRPGIHRIHRMHFLGADIFKMNLSKRTSFSLIPQKKHNLMLTA